MSAVFDLRDRLVARIDESERELERLRAALAAYDGPAVSGTPTPTRGAAARPRVTGGSVSAAQVLAAIPAEGISRARLGEQIGGSEQSVLTELKRLESDGQVLRRGERRATTWHRADAQTGDSPAASQARRSHAAKDTPAATAPSARQRKPSQTASKPSPAAGGDGDQPTAARKPASRTPRDTDQPAAGTSRASRGRRKRQLEPGVIERLLSDSSDGLSVVALARQAGVPETAVRQRLTELQRDGQVRSEGSRRTSLWRLRSDEERIAERAAELAQSSTTA